MKLRNGSNKQAVDFDDTALYPLIGNSACIQELRTAIQKYAQCDAEVLIQGETGVGKGLCARLIHQLSNRHSAPFVEVNCGAIPSGLIASELFGHEKGAFTGAISERIGFIQKAHKGTLFLDEIGDMPPDLQIHLLHFLESKQIHKVGADKFIDVDCRVIAASHVDLKNEVVQGGFREDLFYRLNILPLTIPPLRKRGKDIIILSEHFLADLSHGQVQKMSDKVKAKLLKHRWPGNVRELRNVIQRAIVMCEDHTLLVADLGLDNNERQLLPSVDQIDLDYLLQAIEENKHNMSAAARHLGISRTTLYRLIKKYNLNV
ncbi:MULTISPECIES: sigma-54 interaction domain-containing protein [Vibrio]|jgi:sigma-54 dependent tetracycline resistance transcriptional regulator|uniref:Sigma-54-dependent Fis family transcriptional regulator n=2 Tax=Vibrio alginolyticus TaxID=663 RepID=A0AA36UUG9_VIBAL|nr:MULTISPECIES: sigma-54 dependent transcriptional regulator [Vibrio]EEZ81878.1 putative transcription regulator TxR [Vibrio alginolyticus 40B]QCO85611.1 sigma-54-dependent Fis family transcriptional regulator [Vibrio neocaledonicus]AGV16018.1 putative transcription regulator TxR [Vibrio alginolyticus NBRC 15630 = ATCC 17749]AVF71015.1 sigma-54-dependent Fis family transcriptional regulator [Vibrio alginolyticus]EGQ7646454.1 sigma-54-dependent Fis family transcriptional regulator [Vibrio algi